MKSGEDEREGPFKQEEKEERILCHEKLRERNENVDETWVPKRKVPLPQFPGFQAEGYGG